MHISKWHRSVTAGIAGASVSIILGASGCGDAGTTASSDDEGSVDQTAQALRARRIRGGPRHRFCGGIAGIPCPKGQECVDNPKDDCDPNNGGADCGGICVPATNPCAAVLCQTGNECVVVDGKAVCQPAFCGGIAGIKCPDGFDCVDNPKDDCDPNNGGADCGGICVPATNPCAAVLCQTGSECVVVDGKAVCQPAFCGGIAGIKCADGFDCVDNPKDDCDPNNGGADCGGICVPAKGGAACGKVVCGPGLTCCNASCGICTPPGGVCIQIVCE
jgi:hypothetical protein